MHELIDKLRNYLNERRFFIVLDDLWSVSAWENIMVAFPDNNKSSRIVVTTRKTDVARTCCSPPRDHHMKNIKPLRPENARQLFFKRVFGSEDCPEKNKDLKGVSEDILKKCNGLPLAIISIGGLLASKPRKSVDEWRRVHDRLRSELETNDNLGGLRHVVTLSYNDLPYDLKACFPYLSIFPEDHEIKRGPLVRRWIAEGFVSARHGFSEEEVAESYFDDLVGRSTVIPARVNVTGKVMSCRVHDIMLEVIAAKSIQENFVTLSSGHPCRAALHDKVRRMSIHGSGDTGQALTRSRLSSVRSFTMLGCANVPVDAFSRSALLRVLDLEGCKGLDEKTLRSICKLFGLRYLSLQKTDAYMLPRQVGNLSELETLDVRDTDMQEVPATVTKLRNLKHMLMGSYGYPRFRVGGARFVRWGFKMPAGVGNMPALRTLACVQAENNTILQEVAELTQLQKLHVKLDSVLQPIDWEQFSAWLDRLSYSLCHLSVCGHPDVDYGKIDFLELLKSPPLRLQSLQLQGELGAKVPSWISSLNCLAKITLAFTHLWTNDLVEVLGKLPGLLCLKMYSVWLPPMTTAGCELPSQGAQKSKLCFSPGAFDKLKLLVIEVNSDEPTISFEASTAPSLERLVLSFKEQHGDVLGIGNLDALREIEFGGDTMIIDDSFVEKVTSEAKAYENRPRVIWADRSTVVA